MLQRIQSVWLILASACAFVTLKLPTYSGTAGNGIPSSALMGMSNFMLTVLTVIIGVFALVTIFLYGNRKLQFRFCLLGILLEVILLFLYYSQITKFLEGTLALTSVFHIGVLLFFGLAAKAINNDENLIKSSERLR
ncbi:MAG: DUF4293 domain-containing protein [Ferruginibacter sp.]